jgi:hypothetical protein
MSKVEEKVEEKIKEEAVTTRKRAYKLQYRYKNRFGSANGRVTEKVFWFDGNQKEAVQRARIHCHKMDYDYIFCFPYIVDLEVQERMKTNDVESELEGTEY